MQRYYGNATKPTGNIGLDSFIKVSVLIRNEVPCVRVKVGGNGQLAVFLIKDGHCELSDESL